MDLDETWQVGLRLEKTKPCLFTVKSCYGFQRDHEKWITEAFLWQKQCTTSATFLGSISTKLSTNTCPGGGLRHMVSHSRSVSIKGSNFPKKTSFLGYFTVTCLWPGYGSRETFCDAYTVSIPWWTSHRCALPRWLLLRDVPFSSYPRPNVFLCHGISNGKTWMPMFLSNILARGRNDRITDWHWYTTPVHIF